MVDINDNKTIDIEEAIDIETNHQNSLEIQRVYGDNRPYNEAVVIQEALFYRQASLEAVLEFGKRLVLLKENTEHGRFTEIVNEHFDMQYRAAARIMQACVKLANVSTSTHLIQATKNRSKLFELMILDDTELEELGQGGTVAGIELSDVEKMTVSELRKALKDAKADQDAVRKVSADKDKKINELSERLEKAETKAKKDIEKLKLDESETDRLVKSFKLTLASVSADIGANLTKIQQLLVEAESKHLPESFFKEMAVNMSNLSGLTIAILDDLPQELSNPLDVDWNPDSVILSENPDEETLN